MRKTNGLPAGTASFTRMPLGGGGFSTGIQFANDGTYVHQEDVYGAYIKGPSATSHTQLFTSASLPAADVVPLRPSQGSLTDGEGCYACAIAPSDATRIYATWNASIYKSANGGTSFSKLTGGPYTTLANTGGQRLFHNRMIVDPQNPNVFMFGPQQGNIIYSTDGSTLSSLTVSAGTTNYPHLVAVDPSSSVVGSIKQKWAYSIAGTGIYQSTNGPGGTYSLLSGSPTNPCSMIYDAAGNLWAVDGTTYQVYKKTPAGSFAATSLTVGSQAWCTVAVNPQNTNQVVVMDQNGAIVTSADGGTTWTDRWYPNGYGGGIYAYSTSILWMGKSKTAQIFPSQLAFHPTNGKLYCANGIGVTVANSVPAYGSPWWWYEETLGDESVETDWILCPPGGNAIVAVRDKGFFPLVSEDSTRRLNIQYFPRAGSTLEHGWHCDYVPGAPTHIVGCCSYNNNAHGYSLDGGITWTQFTGNHPDGGIVYGGCIIPASDNDLYWFPANNARAAQSHDQGATWSLISEFSLMSAGAETGFGFSMWNQMRPACSDKATGDVYCWNYGPSAFPALKGIWKRAYGTSTFVRQCTSIAGSGVAGSQARLICVPGNSGHLFFHGDWDTALLRSTDGGQTWPSVANTSGVVAVACGKAAPGKTYPAIYMLGYLSSVWGLYRSDDNCASWTFLGANPGSYAGWINSLAASQDVYGKVYLGTDQSGGFIGTYNSAFSVT